MGRAATMRAIGRHRGNATSRTLTVSGTVSQVATDTDTIINDGTAEAVITVLLQSYDATPLAGIAVVPSASGAGSSVFTPSSVVTDSAGQATFAFTTTGAVAHTISAVANNVTLTDTVTVTGIGDGTPDPATSTVTVDDASIAIDGSAVATLQTKDDQGTNITAGGATVVFGNAGGTSDGTWSATVDNADGTYSSTFTPTDEGTATTVTCTLNAAPVTTSMPTITVSGAFPTPDILDNASFEDGEGYAGNGWSGFSNNGGVPQNPPQTNIIRSTTQAKNGVYSARRAYPNANGGAGCEFLYVFPSALDRVWIRWYFYRDAAIDLQKVLRIFNNNGTQFSGVGTDAGQFGIRVDPEVSTSGFPFAFNIGVSTSDPVGAWHSLEVDWWRNGDTANGGNDYPSIALWYDDVLIHDVGILRAPATWINGRYNLGKRTSSLQMNYIAMYGTQNSGTSPTGNEYVDRFAISSVGRLGP